MYALLPLPECTLFDIHDKTASLFTVAAGRHLLGDRTALPSKLAIYGASIKQVIRSKVGQV